MKFHPVQPAAPGAPPPTPFARAALAGDLRPEGSCVARSLHHVPLPVDRFVIDERKALVASIEQNLAQHEPPVAVLDSLRSLQTPGACVVIAGQQPGLLTSPLLSIYKALHAVRLARNLSQAWECPVVPVFWNHGDDHDIAEVHHTHLLNENLDLQRIRMAGVSSGRQPVSRILLDEEHNQLAAMRGLLLQLLGPEPNAELAVDLCMPQEGDSLVTAFTRTMTKLLGHLGLVMLEPDWIREDLSRALARVVGVDVLSHLEQGSAELREADIEPLIDPREAALVYRVDESGRRALRAGGEGYKFDNEDGSRTAAELCSEIVGEPESYSAGALLRPIVQDLCLPVAAYVGGWAELAYQSQLLPLRRALEAPMTPLVPRMTCTIVEPAVMDSMAKLGVNAYEVLSSKGEFEIDEGPRPAVIDDLTRVAKEAAESLKALKPGLAEIDPGLAQNLDRNARQVRDNIEKLRGKAERVHANRSGKGRRHTRRVQNSLMPLGQLQERVLGPLPLIARYGTDWIDALLEQTAAIGQQHFVAIVNEEATETEEDSE